MSQIKPDEQTIDNFRPSTFKPWRLIFSVLSVMLFISFAIKWYSQSVTLPRFCSDPEMALYYLEKIMTEKSPTGKTFKDRKPYVIAAKLIYLVPKQANEPIKQYIDRVRYELNQRCRS